MKNVFVRIIGPESPEGTETLENCRQRILESYGDLVASERQIRILASDSKIYLIGHGDNPEQIKDLKFGENSPSQVANIIIGILKEFCDPKDGKKFDGLLVLEGCHSAEVGKCSASSFKQQLEEILRKDKTFKNYTNPEAKIGGYLGLAFDAENYQETTYGTASTENEDTKRFQNRRRSYGTFQQGGVTYASEDSYVENRIVAPNCPSPQLTRRAAAQLKQAGRVVNNR